MAQRSSVAFSLTSERDIAFSNVMLNPRNENMLPSVFSSTPPRKKRRTDEAESGAELPSFEEEPYGSPQKMGELGLHVLLSPKNRNERHEPINQVRRVLTFEAGAEDGDKENKGTGGLEYWDRPRESIYVSAFNTAVETVLEREGHLFSQEEMETIDIYRNLPCALQPLMSC